MPAAIGACAAAGAADAANCVAECGAGVYGAAPNGATTYGAACGAACAAGGGSDGAAAAAEAVAVGVGAAAAAEDEEAAGKEKAAGGAFPRVAGAQPALEEEEAAPAPTKLLLPSPHNHHCAPPLLLDAPAGLLFDLLHLSLQLLDPQRLGAARSGALLQELKAQRAGRRLPDVPGNTGVSLGKLRQQFVQPCGRLCLCI
mmetsp:Transcript_85961/g.246745  ORF Transcript_85961/g.246745 Transcript_85961/m.246745 type:complete len:200 (+) Transcript_85961:429-1028(+)